MMMTHLHAFECAAEDDAADCSGCRGRGKVGEMAGTDLCGCVV